jgi:hypothetical protein
VPQCNTSIPNSIAPEKIRFRVRLEGQDPGWKDVGNERKAFYSDLAPRSCRFRVMASNNSRVWKEADDSLDFSIAPAYYRTAWFRASSVAAFFMLLNVWTGVGAGTEVELSIPGSIACGTARARNRWWKAG